MVTLLPHLLSLPLALPVYSAHLFFTRLVSTNISLSHTHTLIWISILSCDLSISCKESKNVVVGCLRSKAALSFLEHLRALARLLIKTVMQTPQQMLKPSTDTAKWNFRIRKHSWGPSREAVAPMWCDWVQRLTANCCYFTCSCKTLTTLMIYCGENPKIKSWCHVNRHAMWASTGTRGMLNYTSCFLFFQEAVSGRVSPLLPGPLCPLISTVAFRHHWEVLLLNFRWKLTSCLKWMAAFYFLRLINVILSPICL